MVSDTPRPDRCAARVTDKVGLAVSRPRDAESRDEMDFYFDDDEGMESVVVTDGSHEVTVEPEWVEVRDYLWSDYDLVALNLSDSEDDETERFEVTHDDDLYIRNRDSELDGYCERYQMDNGRCYVHGGDSPGAPAGNQRATTHGLTVEHLSGYYKHELSEEEKRIVHQFADSWIDDAPFDRDNTAKYSELLRIAVDEVRQWKAHDHFREFEMIDDFVVGVNDDGEEVEVVDENPANLPYDRLDRTTFSKLKDLGCLDDPESQKADAMDQTLTQMFAEYDKEDQ